ncbi:MAG: glycine cleavage system aminomethyltransferase GcvT [Thiotrichaceae bacterium]
MFDKNTEPKRTALYDKHLEAGGKIVDFAGWEMPIHYGSQLNEHHQVRNDAGMFDVSHMVILDFKGSEVKNFLRHLLANNIDKLKDTGKALYSCMLNENGGVIDDLIVYYLSDESYRMVINAATRDNDLAWINQQIKAFDADFVERDDLAMIAVQGPNGREKAMSLLADEDANKVNELKPFFGISIGDKFYARTGYTGEDGFEIMVSNDKAASLWDELLKTGVQPIGLGARDTLRLEAGMNLYGTDMDIDTSPLVAGLSWTVALKPEDRDFLGRTALESEKSVGVKEKFVGLVLEDRGVLRNHQKIITENGEGEITSGTFSPTLKKAIALARVPADIGKQCKVEIRGKELTANVVKPVFVRNGKSCLENT